jgi:DNA replication protein DnaC
MQETVNTKPLKLKRKLHRNTPTTNSQQNIMFVEGDNENISSLSFVGYIQQNYKFSLDGILLEKEYLNDFISELSIEHKIDSYKFKFDYEFNIYESSDFIIRTKRHNGNHKTIVYLSAKSLGTLEYLNTILDKYKDEISESEVLIKSYYFRMNGVLDYFSKNKTIKDFNLNKMYYPYLNIEELFKQYLMSEDNILLLTGEPGTGKTALTDSYMEFFIKSEFVKRFANKEGPIEFKVAYIKNENILSTDEFWVELQHCSYDLIILDDLDYSLLPRTQEISTNEDINKNKFISNLLSFTDGIFDENSKTKFIITTNKEVKEIDTAILRKGRTFDILNLRALTNTEAKNVWLSEKLKISDFDKLFKDKNKILPCDIGSEITKMKMADKYNLKIQSYVNESGISMYSKSKEKRKIGF